MGAIKRIVLSGGPAAGETFQVKRRTRQFQIPVHGSVRFVAPDVTPSPVFPIHIYTSSGGLAHGGYEVFLWDFEKSELIFRPSR